jgi:hypothetical protein
MTSQQSHESPEAWPNYRGDRERIVNSIVAELLSCDEWDEFVHRVVLGKIEMLQEEWSIIVGMENVGMFDWAAPTEEHTFPMLRYAQYWDVTTEVWKDLVIDVLVVLRGHPLDIKAGVFG